MASRTTTLLHGALIAGAITGLAGAVAGCRGDRSDDPPHQFFPGLDDQQKYKAQYQSKFFPDTRTMRQPPAGVVAFSRSSDLEWGDSPADKQLSREHTAQERRDLLREDPHVYLGQDSDGVVLDRMPIREILGVGAADPIDPAVMRRFIERGRERYNIYCIVCHGGLGNADGSVGKLWSGAGPAKLQDPKYHRGGELGQDGHIFQTIRNGLPNVAGQLPAYRMAGYGAQITERDAWAIVAYVRTLQAAFSAPLSEAPESERSRLTQSKPPITPPAPAATGKEAGK